MRALPLPIQAKYLKFKAAFVAWMGCLIAFALIAQPPMWLFNLLFIVPLISLVWGTRFMRRVTRLEREKRCHSPSADKARKRMAWLSIPPVIVLLVLGFANGALYDALFALIPVTLVSALFLYISAIQLEQGKQRDLRD